MVSQSGVAIFALWILPMTLMLELSGGRVRGIARGSAPAVFSYSSGGDSNHPAIISHHYRPIPADPPTRPPGRQMVEFYSTLTPPPSIMNSGNGEKVTNGDSGQKIYDYTRMAHGPPTSSSDGIYVEDSRICNHAPTGDHPNTNPVMYPTSITPHNLQQHNEGRFTNGISPTDQGSPAAISSVPQENYQPTDRNSFNEQREQSKFIEGHRDPPESNAYQERGAFTYTPTPTYYDDSNENYADPDPDFISTTLLPPFESVRNKLPGIDAYPPANPGYITPPLAIRSKVTSTGRDKILQKPKYFAYSNDIPSEESKDGDSKDDGTTVDDQKKTVEKHAKGGGQEHHSSHEAENGDVGKKGYKLHHNHIKGVTGHHDKESHKGKYSDEKGIKGKKKEEAAHFDAAHQAEKGKKAAKYEETGEHKKGHSTKGEHNVHTKDEYLKKHEFYDEHHEGGDHEKSGGFKASHGRRKSSKKKKGHRKSGHRHQHKGKKGHRKKGNMLEHLVNRKDANRGYGSNKHHKKNRSKGRSRPWKIWAHSSSRPEK